MSGFRCSMPPRSDPTPERPPVENCTMMSGQCEPDAFEESRELVRIGGGGLIVVAHVHVHQRRAGLVARVRGLDLLAHGNRNGGVVFLAGYRTVIAAVMMQGA